MDKKADKNFKNIVAVTKLIYKVKKSYFYILLAQAVVKSIILFIPFIFSARIIDELLGDKDMNYLITNAILLVGLTLILSIASKGIEKFETDELISIHWLFDLEKFKKSMSLDYEYLDDPETIKLFTVIRESAVGFGGVKGYTTYVKSILLALFRIIAAIVIIVNQFTISANNFTMGSHLALYIGLFAVLVISIILLSYISTKQSQVQKGFMEILMPLNRLFMYLFERLIFDYKTGKDIRIYGADKQISGMGDKYLKENEERVNQHIRNPNIKLEALTNLINTIAIIAIYMFVVFNAYLGVITIGAVFLVINAISKMYSSITLTIRRYKQLCTTAHFMSKVVDYIELPARKYEGTIPVVKRSDNKYYVEFENVSFKYPGTDEYVLKNVTCNIDIGKHMAVVGENGAGKTTMIKLLCRLYDPDEGTIKLNGIDIRKYKLQEYKSLFSVVFQDFMLFEQYSLKENISISEEPDTGLVNETMETAGLHNLMEELDGNLDIYMSKNLNANARDFSGGERQKIAIARALYKDSPIVILDEPTAALDPIAEYEIYSRFNELVKNKTSVFISHRLSSCRFCDEILVFNEGELVQRGSHESLLKDTEGKYSELWNAQAEFYD